MWHDQIISTKKEISLKTWTASIAILAHTLSCQHDFAAMQKQISFQKRTYRNLSSGTVLFFHLYLYFFSWITHLSQTLKKYKEVSDPDAKSVKGWLPYRRSCCWERNGMLCRLFLSFLPGVRGEPWRVWVDPGNN